MADRTGRGWPLVLACLLLAGCGSGAITPRAPPPGPTARNETATQRCAKAARLTPRTAVPGWHMGAIQFLSPAAGVGITAEHFPCFRPVAGGAEVGFQRQPVRLAITRDGGRSWRVMGAPLPVGSVPGETSAEEMAATSPVDLWALVGNGRLVATSDGGSHWQLQAVPHPVVQVATGEGGGVWAMSCPHVASQFPLACRPQLWRTRGPNDPWAPVKLPRVTAEGHFAVRFAIASRDMIVVLTEASRRPTGDLLTSDDAGSRWTLRRAPRWDHNACDIPAALAAERQRTFWLLCLGGAAAGSSTKALLRSIDAGRTWSTLSAVTSLTQRQRPGSIPLTEPSALAAGSQARLWLSLTNGLAESDDGGRHWMDVPQAFDSGGWTIVIDVLGARHAWLLAPGAGLWRTPDGVRWSALRPLNNG